MMQEAAALAHLAGMCAHTACGCNNDVVPLGVELLQVGDITLNGLGRGVVTLDLRPTAQSVVKVEDEAQAGLIWPLSAEVFYLNASASTHRDSVTAHTLHVQSERA